MTDWADVAASRALSMCNLLAYSHDDHSIIAAALRKARLDALEEAANVSEDMLKSYDTMDNIPAAIRSLKDKL